MFAHNQLLLVIGEMCYFSRSLLNVRGNLFELSIIDLKLTVIEVSLFYWITDLLKLGQFFLIF